MGRLRRTPVMGECGYKQRFIARPPGHHVGETECFVHVIMLATEESFYYMSMRFAPRRGCR